MGSAGILTGPLPPALLLLYDVTNKASFNSIQVSGFLPGGGDRPRWGLTPSPASLRHRWHQDPRELRSLLTVWRGKDCPSGLLMA